MFATKQEKTGLYYDLNARLVIYAPDALGTESSKTAEGVLRYASNPIVGVIDKSQAGKTVRQVTGIPLDLPVFASLEEALELKPQALLLGTAWSGGGLPPSWKPDLLKALEAGLDIVNGLHDFLSDDPELSKAAEKNSCKLIDVRRPPEHLPVGTAACRNLDSFVVLTVGTDCSVGKMTSSLELAKVAREKNKKAAFVATGQTGIMICGTGIAIDRVIGDFMSGAVEQMVLEAAVDNDYVFVEGQGSIVHPSFSGVTLSLMHGACPKALILCHNAKRSKIKEKGIDMDILPLDELVSLYERLCSYLQKTKVLGVAFNTHGMSEEDAAQAIASAEKLLNIPVCDPVRQGAGRLFDAIEKYKESLA
ncbi:MAG: DUF1611 domain-containing protein [Candidatus Obscuribacterales bacterium]|nr:DUF1611 domain-containing protein [Candidatus Obscuribacterales bacterium]